MNILTILLSIGGFLGGFLSLKFLIINHYRVNRSVGGLLYKKIKNDSSFKFIIQEELIFDKKDPNIFKALIRLESIMMFVDKGERLFTAGWIPKESIIDVYFFRWNTKAMKKLLAEVSKRDKITNIYAVAPYDCINIGTIDCNNYGVVLDDCLPEGYNFKISEKLKSGELIYNIFINKRVCREDWK